MQTSKEDEPMQSRLRRPSPALVVAVVALVGAVAGTAVADPAATTSALSKKKVKKIANKEIAKQFPVATDQIVDGAVTAAKLADGAVTGAKLANDAVSVVARTATSAATTDSDGTQNGGATSVNRATATANCQAGEQVIGGGAEWSAGDTGNNRNLYVSQSHPSGNGWRAVGIVDFGAQGTARIQSTAYCLQ
jgi:hypothetical protein